MVNSTFAILGRGPTCQLRIVTSVPENPAPSLASAGTQHAHGAHTCKQAK